MKTFEEEKDPDFIFNKYIPLAKSLILILFVFSEK
jgi:hypothetical protein